MKSELSLVFEPYNGIRQLYDNFVLSYFVRILDYDIYTTNYDLSYSVRIVEYDNYSVTFPFRIVEYEDYTTALFSRIKTVY